MRLDVDGCDVSADTGMPRRPPTEFHVFAARKSE